MTKWVGSRDLKEVSIMQKSVLLNAPGNPLHAFLPYQSIITRVCLQTSLFPEKLLEWQKRQSDMLSTCHHPQRHSKPVYFSCSSAWAEEQRGEWLVASD